MIPQTLGVLFNKGNDFYNNNSFWMLIYIYLHLIGNFQQEMRPANKIISQWREQENVWVTKMIFLSQSHIFMMKIRWKPKFSLKWWRGFFSSFNENEWLVVLRGIQLLVVHRGPWKLPVNTPHLHHHHHQVTWKPFNLLTVLMHSMSFTINWFCVSCSQDLHSFIKDSFTTKITNTKIHLKNTRLILLLVQKVKIVVT